jgi:hypothetical protein
MSYEKLSAVGIDGDRLSAFGMNRDNWPEVSE